MTRFALLLVALVFAAGCGGRPQSEIDRGKQAVVAALDSWKAKEPPTKLKALPDPVEFSEELRATHALADYELGKVDATDKDVLEVPPGRHTLRVQVHWEDNDRTERIQGNFRAGETRRLQVRLGRLRKNLSLEWE